MEQVLIGFGSNQGDPVQYCLGAVERLRRHPQIKVQKVSSLYRTKPVGGVEQDWFINGVLQAETTLVPEALLDLIHQVEQDFGRTREVHWGPRTLDLDILAYGGHVLNLEHLIVPHPRLHERLFVVAPLVEIAPDWVHPTLKLSARGLLERLSEQGHDQEVHRLESV